MGGQGTPSRRRPRPRSPGGTAAGQPRAERTRTEDPRVGAGRAAAERHAARSDAAADAAIAGDTARGGSRGGRVVRRGTTVCRGNAGARIRGTIGTHPPRRARNRRRTGLDGHGSKYSPAEGPSSTAVRLTDARLSAMPVPSGTSILSAGFPPDAHASAVPGRRTTALPVSVSKTASGRKSSPASPRLSFRGHRTGISGPRYGEKVGSASKCTPRWSDCEWSSSRRCTIAVSVPSRRRRGPAPPEQPSPPRFPRTRSLPSRAAAFPGRGGARGEIEKNAPSPPIALR